MIISTGEKAKELDPNLLEVEVIRGVVLYHQKRFEEAKKTIRKFIEKKDDYYPAYFWLGVNEEITGEHNAALKHFTRARDIKPYSEEPWIHIEMIYRRMGDLNASQAAAKKIIETANKKIEGNARDGVALSRIAASYARSGNKPNALETLKKVLDIAPNDGLALYNCACTYAQLGKKTEAYDHLKKAINVGYKNIVEWIENDPDFKPFQDDPEFKKILSGTDN
ncbi:MAG: tetratricopeptide repeat protein [Ignavibacteriaceae bacterium]